jgi:hypothetical protein
MKSLYVFIFSLVLIAAAGNTIKAQESKEVSSSMKWEQTTIDFGKIPKGKPVTADFILTNTSMVPLIINSVSTSCGCTVADYPKEPVLPGNTAKISATFNAASEGPFQKSVLVSSNATEGRSTLIIKGEVLSQ